MSAGTAKWVIRRVVVDGIVVWRISCVPLGVRGHYWSWETAIERAYFWSKHPEGIGWQS